MLIVAALVYLIVIFAAGVLCAFTPPEKKAQNPGAWTAIESLALNGAHAANALGPAGSLKVAGGVYGVLLPLVLGLAAVVSAPANQLPPSPPAVTFIAQPVALPHDPTAAALAKFASDSADNDATQDATP